MKRIIYVNVPQIILIIYVVFRIFNKDLTNLENVILLVGFSIIEAIYIAMKDRRQ